MVTRGSAVTNKLRDALCYGECVVTNVDNWRDKVEMSN